MSIDIVKICKHHGPLRSNRVRISFNNKGYRVIDCISCRTAQTLKCRAKNPFKKRSYSPHKGKMRTKRADQRKAAGNMECKLCKTLLPLKKFNPSAIYKFGPVCKFCNQKHDNSRYLVKKNNHFVKKYGITYTDFKIKSSAQNDLCSICNRPQKIINKKHNLNDLYIDHCHKTGKMRGLICSTCNLGIGQFEDSYELLLKVARYIKKYSSP